MTQTLSTTIPIPIPTNAQVARTEVMTQVEMRTQGVGLDSSAAAIGLVVEELSTQRVRLLKKARTANGITESERSLLCELEAHIDELMLTEELRRASERQDKLNALATKMIRLQELVAAHHR